MNNAFANSAALAGMARDMMNERVQVTDVRTWQVHTMTRRHQHNLNAGLDKPRYVEGVIGRPVVSTEKRKVTVVKKEVR